MIVHSIAPLGMLLPPDGAPPQQTMTVGGATLAGRRTAEGFVVSQVLSTDPRVFLDARFAPGQVIRCGPKI